MTLSLQPARDAHVKQTLARAAGLALIDATSALEDGMGIPKDASQATMALVAFAARGRRLLRSAYRLLDAGERDGAAPIFRVLNEYLIVGRWLLTVDKSMQHKWGLEDLRERLVTINDVLDHATLDEEGREHLLVEVRRIETAIRGYGEGNTPISRRASKKAGWKPPSLEAMATAAGLDFVYAYPYRLASQRDVHATAAAVDAAFEESPEGLVVRASPLIALDGHESYLLGAHLLVDIVRPLADTVPELGWKAIVDMLADVLVSITRAERTADA